MHRMLEIQSVLFSEVASVFHIKSIYKINDKHVLWTFEYRREP